MGQRGKRRGLTGLPCCRMKDATTWKTVAARVHARPPPPLLPWKGLFFIIQNIQSFKLWKTAAVIRIIGPLYSPRIRSVTNNGFSKFNSPRWSRIGNWLRFEKEKMFWKQSKFDDKVRRWRRKVKILIFNRIGWFWTYGDFLKSCFPFKR